MESSDNLIQSALRIRMVEEKIIELYPTDQIQSPVHLSIGQEAVAVGVCGSLRDDDWVFINYRGHAFYLAKGGPLPEFFAELMGKSTGISKGKAGSMHLADPTHGIMGASAVVASTISHAVGAALASKIKNVNSRVFVANFGDGALEQGVFYESLNFAALHNLPVLFLCEDNELAVHASKSDRQSFNLEKLVESFSIPYSKIDNGFDPNEIFNKTKGIVGYIRKNQKPFFLHIKTQRYKEHVGPGEDFSAGYRAEADMDSWKDLDPIFSYKDNNPEIVENINREIKSAIDFAYSSSVAVPTELLTDVI